LKTFHAAIQTQAFTLTGQLKLADGTTPAELLEQAELLRPFVDAVQVTDNPSGLVHMSPLAAASLLLQAGIDPIVQLSCRDRNRIALQSELLGAAAIGVSSLLLQRGHKLPKDYQPKTKQVFDIGAKRLVGTARAIQQDPRLANAAKLFIGTIALAFDPTSKWKPDALLGRSDAGARFIQTQLCFDVDVLRRYVRRLSAAKLTHRVHVIVSLGTLPSADAALWLQKNLRGSVMPKAVIRRMEQARDPEQEGVKICAELLQEVVEIPGVDGANLLTPGELETLPAAIQASGLRERVSEVSEKHETT
jgi:methylenetetrahydrofolate reductase (NADPH)